MTVVEYYLKKYSTWTSHMIDERLFSKELRKKEILEARVAFNE